MTQLPGIRDQMKALESVQELDLKIDSLKGKKAELPLALKQSENAYRQAQAAVEAKKTEIFEKEKIQKQAQAAIDLNKDRLARAGQKLEAVQNSQEYNAANKEMDQLRRAMLGFEDQIKKASTEIESAAKDMTGLEEKLGVAKKSRDEQAQEIAGKTGNLDGEIGGLLEQRNQFSAQVDRRVLSQYDRIRGARGGIGLVPVNGGRCSGCNMMVPPQLFNEVQKNTQVHQCPSCHRIIYVPEK